MQRIISAFESLLHRDKSVQPAKNEGTQNSIRVLECEEGAGNIELSLRKVFLENLDTENQKVALFNWLKDLLYRIDFKNSQERRLAGSAIKDSADYYAMKSYANGQLVSDFESFFQAMDDLFSGKSGRVNGTVLSTPVYYHGELLRSGKVIISLSHKDFRSGTEDRNRFYNPVRIDDFVENIPGR